MTRIHMPISLVGEINFIFEISIKKRKLKLSGYWLQKKKKYFQCKIFKISHLTRKSI